MCGYPNKAQVWMRRECDPQFGRTAWFDLCSQTPWSGVQFPNIQAPSSCTAGNVCQNIHDGKDLSIKCVNHLRAGKSAARKTPTDPMIGYSHIYTASKGNQQFEFTVKIENDMKASVAAFILSKFFVQITLFWC
jgi:hypothetical protein